MHVGERELVLAFVCYVFGIFLLKELFKSLFLSPFLIFLGSEQHGGVEIGVAYLRTDIVKSGGVVVFRHFREVVGSLEVDGYGVEVICGEGCRPSHPPSGLCG